MSADNQTEQGPISSCCDAPDPRPEAIALNRSGVPDGRLRLHDVTAVIVTTCAGCGETSEPVSRPGSEVTTCDFCGHQGPPVGKNSECGSCGAVSFHQAPDGRPSRPGEAS